MLIKKDSRFLSQTKSLKNQDNLTNPDLSSNHITKLTRLQNLNLKSQVTILIILAIVIVAGIVVFFAFRQDLVFGGPPKDIEPVYNHYLNCIEQETMNGISILSQQGGYI
mgnify:FL=1